MAQTALLFKPYNKNFEETRIERVFNVLILAILGFVLIFSPLAYGAVEDSMFYIFHISCLAVFFLSILKMVCTRKIRLTRSYAFLPIVLFIIYAFVWTLFSDIPYFSRHELLRIMDYGIVFFAVTNNFNRKRYLYVIIFIFLLVSLAMSLIGVINYLKAADTVPGIGFKHEIVSVPEEGAQIQEVKSYFGLINKIKPKQYGVRASGTYICPNHFAGYLVVVLPLCLAMAMLTRFLPGIKMLVGYSCAVIMAGWVLSFSRGGWIAGVIMLICFAILGFMRDETTGENKWILPVIIISALLIGLGIFVKPIQERVLSIRPSGDSSAITRVKIWADTVQMIKEKPILGYGPASFGWHYPKFRHEELKLRVAYTHNDYLNTLVDYGIVGFVIILSFIVIILSRVNKIPLYFEHPDTQAIMIGSLSAVVAVLVHAVFDFNNHIYSNALLFMVVAGISLAVDSTIAEDEKDYFICFDKINKNVFSFITVSLILIFISVALLFHGMRLFSSELFLLEGNAYQNEVLWDQAVNKYEAAQKIDPINPNVYIKLAEISRGKNLFRMHSSEEAVNYYNMAIKYNPYDSNLYFKKAMLLRSDKNYEEAIKALRQAIEIQPTHDVYIRELKKVQKSIMLKNSSF